MAYTLIETCCGSAALTLHLLGATRPLLPYQGGKWRWRRELASLLRQGGFSGVPRRVELYDVSSWGLVAAAVIQPSTRAGIIDHLEFMGRLDPKAVYEALHGQPVPEDVVEYAAQYLFLQRLSYSGKAVGVRDGRWLSPGFNPSSAYGLAGTERFGEVLPMIPSLVKVLQSYASVVAPERLFSNRAGAPRPTGRRADPVVVYMDPPYANSTRYPDGDLDRKVVLELARLWQEAGAAVAISESVPLDTELGSGWSATKIYEGRADESPFRGKQAEWVTLSPGWPAS